MSGSEHDRAEDGLRTSVFHTLSPFRRDFFLKPRQPFIGITLCAAFGIWCADRWPIGTALAFAALAVVALASLVCRTARLTLPFVACAFFALHTLQFQLNAGRALVRQFSPNPESVRAIGIVLEETEQKPAPERLLRAQFQMRLESLAIGGSPPQACEAKVLVKWHGTAPRYGDRIALDAPARLIPPTRNPGQFDHTGYLHRLGIYCEIDTRHAGDGRVLDHGRGNPVRAFALKTRHWMQRQLTVDLDDSPDIAGMIQGMVLGLKAETPPEIKEMFQRTGTLHLFVVNGLHVGMFATILWLLIRPMQLGHRWAVLVIIPLLAFYALVTGLSPGSIRATVMAAIILGGRIFERPSLMFNNLFAAAFVLLLWDTNELFMPAFQFSFGVVFSILLLAGKFQRRLIPLAAPDPFLPRPLWSFFQNARVLLWRRAAQLLGVSLAAWIGSLPFTARYFHLFSPSAVVANLFIVPLAFAILAQGVLAMLCGAFSGSLAAIFNNANWAVAKLILVVVRFFTLIPGGHVYVETPRLREPVCEINVLDLGDGGAIHLRSPGRDWLFDTGGAFDYESVVRPYLRTRGANRLDGILVSHGDSGHIGGALLALDDFSPRQIVDSSTTDRSKNRRALHAELAARGLGKGIYQRGDWLRISPAIRARVLYPPGGIVARTADDKALVLQLEAGKTRVLFTFDSGFATEHWLLENERDLRSDILVKGRHASDISGTIDFIEAVAPRAIVTPASARDQPTRFTPETMRFSEAWAEQIAAHGIALFRQDETGAVNIEIARDGFVVRGFANGQIFRSRTR